VIKYIIFVFFIAVYSVGCGNSDEKNSTVESEVSNNHSVHGMGQTTCLEVNDHFDKEGFQFGLRVWLDGYYTAINSATVKHNFEVDIKGLEGSISLIKLNCLKKGNQDLWIAHIVSMFWRQKFFDTVEQ
tara:strand:+ start:129 stop:515 length:387 start_codon:yes stop_codon:yes gene_type:complete